MEFGPAEIKILLVQMMMTINEADQTVCELQFKKKKTDFVLNIINFTLTLSFVIKMLINH